MRHRCTAEERQIPEELQQFLQESVARLPSPQVNGNASVRSVWIYFSETHPEFLILNHLPKALTSTEIRGRQVKPT